MSRTILERFGSYGYELVTTPPFELAEVIERGLDTVDRRELLRFVDSDTGEVALLRPDITPQIARVVATRLADRPGPHRVAYEGFVIRRRRGRARRQRQIAQAGVECIGLSGPAADVEVIELASRTLDRVGLTAHHVELGLVPLTRALLSHIPEALRGEATDALSRKDRSAIESACERAQVSHAVRRSLCSVAELYGGAEVLDAARRTFRGKDEARAIAALAELHQGLVARGHGPRVSIDLGEVRGFGYYTGASFLVHADGPGEPLGGGGRYDDLLGRFGAPMPATGFGLDLDHVEWALASAGIALPAGRELSIALSGEAAAVLPWADALRDAGARVATLDGDSGAFAEAWHYAIAAQVTGTGSRARVALRRLADGAERTSRDLREAAQLVAWATSAGTRG